MHHTHKGKIGCPRFDSYSEACPNIDGGNLDCPAKQSLAAPCPFMQNADPGPRDPHIQRDFSHGDLVQAMRRGLKDAVKEVVSEVVSSTVAKETPGTIPHLLQELQAREDSKKNQDDTATQLQREYAAWVSLDTQHGHKVTLSYRAELRSYLPEPKCFWPTGRPIVTLGESA